MLFMTSPCSTLLQEMEDLTVADAEDDSAHYMALCIESISRLRPRKFQFQKALNEVGYDCKQVDLSLPWLADRQDHPRQAHRTDQQLSGRRRIRPVP